ncbi:MAG: tyrosine-type recombinase/integrase [Bacteroidetes Order II. Incertae sedis bacterium]|jgi:integrase|nr:tyrosine-type recombinase/integrase [Bacteroidetes Order II. bacterium]
MALTDLAAKRAKPKEKDYKLSVERGLYLQVKTNGAKYWRMKYRFAGKEKTLSFGVYPEVSLAEAMDRLDTARRLLRDDTDPGLEKKKAKLRRRIENDATFETVAREWVTMKSKKWAPRHTERVLRSLELDIFPSIGNVPISQIDSVLLRSVIDPIQSRGALDIASRVRQRCGSVFRYGMATGVCTTDPAEPLKVVMETPVKKHFPALSANEMPEFLTKVRAYNCTVQTRLAMRFLMLTFVRTIELIGARWDEIDFEESIWNIPSERMKENQSHFVPLSTQSIECLNQLHLVTGKCELLFPKRGTSREPMSNSTILRVIERIGYKGRMTGHGFRSVASSILNESGLFDFDAIERQLSHQDRDDVRAAYNRAKYMNERRRMMQWWADKLDSLENPSQIVYPMFQQQP